MLSFLIALVVVMVVVGLHYYIFAKNISQKVCNFFILSKKRFIWYLFDVFKFLAILDFWDNLHLAKSQIRRTKKCARSTPFSRTVDFRNRSTTFLSSISVEF